MKWSYCKILDIKWPFFLLHLTPISPPLFILFRFVSFLNKTSFTIKISITITITIAIVKTTKRVHLFIQGFIYLFTYIFTFKVCIKVYIFIRNQTNIKSKFICTLNESICIKRRTKKVILFFFFFVCYLLYNCIILSKNVQNLYYFSGYSVF